MSEERRTAARHRRGVGRQARVARRGAGGDGVASAATTSRCGSCCASRSARPRWWCPRNSAVRAANSPTPRSCSRSSARRWCRRRCWAPRSPNSRCWPPTSPDAETLERLAEGTSIGAVVFDPGYVVNGDVADVVIAADGTTADPMDELHRAPRRHHGPDASAGAGRAQGHHGHRRRSRSRRHRRDPAGRRADRRRREVSGSDRRIHQGPRAVRPPDRQLPGAQAPDGRPVRRGAVRAGAWSTTRSPNRRPTSAALARVAASEAFSKVAAEAVQMHGGIAITWEHDIQLYFKRAHGSAQLLGPPREHLRRLESEVF